MKIKIICNHCKNEFVVPYKQRNKKYCTQQCYFDSGIKGKPKQEHLYEKRVCTMCNKEFEVRKKQPNKLCSDECRKEWNKIHSSERTKKSIDAILEKYNGVYFLQTEEFKLKTKKTKIEKYGTENHMLNEKVREKFFKSIEKIYLEKKDEIVKKRSNKKLEKYGDKNYNNKEKIRETINEKYGDFHLNVPEIMQKSKNTHFKNFGVFSPFQLEENRKKMTEKIIEKYNGPYCKTEQYKSNVKDKRYESVKNRVEKKGFVFINYIDNEYAIMKCKTCGDVFTHTQVHGEYNIVCRKCNPIKLNNSLNLFVEEIFHKNNIYFSKNNIRELNRKEIDYLINKIGFELNGNYYHSEINGGKNKKYHIDKTILSHKKGIKLIHIFEDEIKNKPNIVVSRIENLLGLSKIKIHGRKCLIKEVNKNESKLFLTENHLQGDSVDKFRYGLYYENELVSIMTFGMKRRSLGNKTKNGHEYELLRFCNKTNTNVIGGFSKLLKFFINTNSPKHIITYADIRWSGIDIEDNVYFKNGFSFVHITPPNYWYVNKKNFLDRKHRFQFRKDILIKEGFDVEKSEWEIMKERGYDRIWDCGNMKFEIVFH